MSLVGLPFRLIQYASDLHLELAHNADFLLAQPIEPAGDITSLTCYKSRQPEKAFFLLNLQSR